MSGSKNNKRFQFGMARFELTTKINASPAICFDLSRDLDLHQSSMESSGEKAISGRTTGLIELHEEVTWRARHLGFWHTHRSRITAYDRPDHFRDSIGRRTVQKV